jgi:hypothetical protein
VIIGQGKIVKHPGSARTPRILFHQLLEFPPEELTRAIIITGHEDADGGTTYQIHVTDMSQADMVLAMMKAHAWLLKVAYAEEGSYEAADPGGTA